MIYFSTYESCKGFLERRGASGTASHLASASMGAVMSAFVRVPTDTLRHQTQAYLIPNFVQVSQTLHHTLTHLRRMLHVTLMTYNAPPTASSAPHCQWPVLTSSDPDVPAAQSRTILPQLGGQRTRRDWCWVLTIHSLRCGVHSSMMRSGLACRVRRPLWQHRVSAACTMASSRPFSETCLS